MFTGIIQASGVIAATKPLSGEGRRIAVRWPVGLTKPRVGDSIAVDGVCLTAQAGRGRLVFFDLSPETLSLTTLGALEVGSVVHLEPALRIGDPLGGHLLTGHVDAVARVRSLLSVGEGFRRLEIDLPRRLLPFVAVKGSLAVDGVSLTVNALRGTRVGFMIVPHTLRVTRIGAYRQGTRVNVEADLLARYVVAALAGRSSRSKGGHGPSRC